MGPAFRPHRPIVEGVLFRLRTGIPWRDLAAEFGSWQTAHRRHQSWSEDGTRDRVLAAVQADADAAGQIDWRCSVEFHNREGASRRCYGHEVVVDRRLAHRGRRRMTRVACGARTNRTITPSVGPAAG
jgi:transposase